MTSESGKNQQRTFWHMLVNYFFITAISEELLVLQHWSHLTILNLGSTLLAYGCDTLTAPLFPMSLHYKICATIQSLILGLTQTFWQVLWRFLLLWSGSDVCCLPSYWLDWKPKTNIIAIYSVLSKNIPNGVLQKSLLNFLKPSDLIIFFNGPLLTPQNKSSRNVRRTRIGGGKTVRLGLKTEKWRQ